MESIAKFPRSLSFNACQNNENKRTNLIKFKSEANLNSSSSGELSNIHKKVTKILSKTIKTSFLMYYYFAVFKLLHLKICIYYCIFRNYNGLYTKPSEVITLE